MMMINKDALYRCITNYKTYSVPLYSHMNVLFKEGFPVITIASMHETTSDKISLRNIVLMVSVIHSPKVYVH